MSSDEFRALLKRNREKALEAFFEAWLDANSESRRDTIKSLASLATYEGVPRIEVGSDEDLAAAYDEVTGNDVDEHERDAVAAFAERLVAAGDLDSFEEVFGSRDPNFQVGALDVVRLHEIYEDYCQDEDATDE